MYAMIVNSSEVPIAVLAPKALLKRIWNFSLKLFAVHINQRNCTLRRSRHTGIVLLLSRLTIHFSSKLSLRNDLSLLLLLSVP